MNSFLTRWGNYSRRGNYSREETIIQNSELSVAWGRQCDTRIIDSSLFQSGLILQTGRERSDTYVTPKIEEYAIVKLTHIYFLIKKNIICTHIFDYFVWNYDEWTLVAPLITWTKWHVIKRFPKARGGLSRRKAQVENNHNNRDICIHVSNWLQSSIIVFCYIALGTNNKNDFINLVDLLLIMLLGFLVSRWVICCGIIFLNTPGPWLVRFLRSGKNPHEPNLHHLSH